MEKERDELREAARDPGLRLRLEDGDEAAEKLLQARVDAMTPVRFDELMRKIDAASAAGRKRQGFGAAVLDVLKIAGAAGLLA